MRTNEAMTPTALDPAPTDKLALAVKTLAGDMRSLIAATSDQAGRRVGEMRARAETTGAAAFAGLAAMPGAAWSKATGAGRTADDYLRAHRWEVLAISVIAGFVAGVVLARRGPTST